MGKGKQINISEHKIIIDNIKYEIVGHVNKLLIYYNPEEGYRIKGSDGNSSEPTLEQLKEINNNYEKLEERINKFTEEYKKTT